MAVAGGSQDNRFLTGSTALSPLLPSDHADAGDHDQVRPDCRMANLVLFVGILGGLGFCSRVTEGCAALHGVAAACKILVQRSEGES